MDYHEEFIVDFAKRTKANLDFVLANEQEGRPVFEVTQLVNSMLGMLVFPREQYVNRIPNRQLSELSKEGWPTVNVVEGEFRRETLRELLRMLRNGIAHCNVKFTADDKNQITGIVIWNRCQCNRITWKAKLSLQDLRLITEKFIELIVSESGVKTDARKPHRKSV